MSTLGERICTRRLELNLTQLELAQKLGYTSRSSINKIEKDINSINLEKITAFAEALQTTTDYILGVTENAPVSENKSISLVERLYNQLTPNNKLKAVEYINSLIEK